ncbi:MAG TPA: 50S ribosomal protein L6 [Actinomycetota bacterium]|jgi:large subunit ribosomal protein L6|nr:50S ribosomal protein L6 [Actinomycetota bacterium]
MSRIGKEPITVPAGVDVTLEPQFVRVKGPKGTLERVLPKDIVVSQEGNTITVTRPTESGEHRSLHGLTRTLIANLVQGVTEEFTKNLEIHGVGYRCALKGDTLELSLGYSHPVVVPTPPGITFEVPTPTRITVRGADKELVGQIAANIRAKRKPDPYKQKGVRYAGEVIRKKAGKTSK